MNAIWQFARYVVTGVVSLLVDLGVLRALLMANLAQEFAVAVAFIAGVIVNLLMHKFFTFRDSSRLHAWQAARFLAVVGLNLSLTELIVWLATHEAGFGVFAAKLASLPLVLAIGFTLSRKWVFVPRTINST